VYQVERLLLDWVTHDVVPYHLDGGTWKIVQELGIQIGGNHPTGTPDGGS
jgi:hypothetical protein